MSLTSSFFATRSVVVTKQWTQHTQDIWYWMSVGFSTHELHHRKHTTPSKSWVKCNRKKRLYEDSAAICTSSSGSIVWDASFCLGCNFQPPPCLDPNGFLFVWLPRHVGAMLRWDRVHSGYFFFSLSLSLSLSLPLYVARGWEKL